MHILLLCLIYFAVFVVLVVIFAFTTDRLLRTKGYSGPVSDHFDGTRFFNLGSTPGKRDSIKENLESLEDGDHEPQPRSMIAWLIYRKREMWLERKAKTAIPAKKVEGDRLVVTFVNHSTVLIQTQGLNILTDPHWSYRASPVRWAGPRRYQDPGIRFEDLPHIDVVLLSHNHYDHMDIPTLQRLQKRFSPKVFVPLGDSPYLTARGIPGAVEMDWFNKQQISEVVGLTMVPAQHFSARAISDRNKTLWGGYVLNIKSGDVYFAGDTGFGPWIDQLSNAFPDGFRLAILPIGAFKPRSYMKEVHVSPTEALKIKDKIKAREAVAIHFGTFMLASDKQDEPATVIAQSNEGEQGTFIALRNGGSREIK